MFLFRNSRKYLPSFLQQLDHHWLLRHPFVWATRVHIVVYYGLMGVGLSLVLSQLPEVSPANIPEGWHYFVALGIPTLIGLVYWIWRVSTLQAAFPAYWHERLGIAALYFLGFFSLLAGPLTAWTIVDQRVEQMRSTVPIQEDAYVLTLGYHFFKDLAPVPSTNPFLELSHVRKDSAHVQFQRMLADSVQRDEFIQSFQQTVQRYLPGTISERMMAHYSGRTREAYSFIREVEISGWLHSIESKLTKLTQPPNYPFRSGKGSAWTMVLWFLIVPLCGLLLAFVQVGWEGSLGIVAIGTALGLLDMLSLIFLDSVLNFTLSFQTPWFILLFNILGLLYLGTLPQEDRLWHIREPFKQSCLILALGGLYFLLLFAPTLVTGLEGSPSLLYLMIVASTTLALWIGVVQPSLLRMKAQPKY